eukprot:scaffold178_cov255-Pinguiococcus_pyrenoidosus.AAC.7
MGSEFGIRNSEFSHATASPARRMIRRLGWRRQGRQWNGPGTRNQEPGTFPCGVLTSVFCLDSSANCSGLCSTRYRSQ